MPFELEICYFVLDMALLHSILFFVLKSDLPLIIVSTLVFFHNLLSPLWSTFHDNIHNRLNVATHSNLWCNVQTSSSYTCLMLHTTSHKKKCWSGSSTLVPWNTGNLISSPILFLCKGGFCCMLEVLGWCSGTRGKVVYCVCVLTGCVWLPPGISGVCT